MPRLYDLLDLGHVALDVHSTSSSELLEKLSNILVDQDHLSAQCGQSLCNALLHRERQGGTCLGNGVAVPHGYCVDLDRPIMLLARLDPPITFTDNPHIPAVDLVFLLTGPESAQKQHLKVLARIVRLLHDEAWLAELRSAPNAEAILESVKSVERRHV